jgi:hypothetical protein
MKTKYLRQMKKIKLRKQYEKYYAALTSEDKEDEIRLVEDFKFSDREVELHLRSEESSV